MDKNRPSITTELFNYFMLTFIFSWLFWSVGIAASLGWITIPFPKMVFAIIGAHGPLLVAFSLTYRADGRGAVLHLLKAGFRFRMKAIWWLVIILIPFILNGLAVWTNTVYTDFQLDTTLLSQPVMILPTFLMMFFMGGSFQEEFGWRGYALPRLLRKWNPLIASIILGVVWGLWHLPLFFISGTSQVYMPIGVFLLMVITFSVLFTWFYLKTDRNLFSALLFHAAINTALSVFPPIEKVVGGNQQAITFLMILNMVVAIIVVMSDGPFWFRVNDNNPTTFTDSETLNRKLHDV